MKGDDDAITQGSGNVFADLNLPKAEERNVNARLASKVLDAIEARGWNQARAAPALGISQQDVSRVTRGILKDYSVERLMQLLHKLDYRVTIQGECARPTAEEIVVLAQE
ncbi:MAG: helix-turn-helix transcriptional regulator [Trueperaceae bacterium]